MGFKLEGEEEQEGINEINITPLLMWFWFCWLFLW